ncbi:hypothetical protein ANANG_G00137110 [Anguilla anguilla]|uniref:Uncharacterized protein n=1 Tax=Anguilla anguilla TaxID=7936 RepID=A0A9D3MA45_ANGAN|nr:hypothetical protein ANANG_G00137110 [Anguilla anguilla]
MPLPATYIPLLQRHQERHMPELQEDWPFLQGLPCSKEAPILLAVWGRGAPPARLPPQILPQLLPARPRVRGLPGAGLLAQALPPLRRGRPLPRRLPRYLETVSPHYPDRNSGEARPHGCPQELSILLQLCQKRTFWLCVQPEKDVQRNLPQRPVRLPLRLDTRCLPEGQPGAEESERVAGRWPPGTPLIHKGATEKNRQLGRGKSTKEEGERRLKGQLPVPGRGRGSPAEGRRGRRKGRSADRSRSFGEKRWPSERERLGQLCWRRRRRRRSDSSSEALKEYHQGQPHPLSKARPALVCLAQGNVVIGRTGSVETGSAGTGSAEKGKAPRAGSKGP